MLKFEAVFGIAAGYGHGNTNVEEAQAASVVARAWRTAMEADFSASSILVGAVVTAGRVVYPADFGCPENGEVVATVRGDANPKFVEPDKLDDFREAVIRIAEAVRTALRQERVQLSFSSNDGFVYYEPADSGGIQRWGCAAE